MAAMASERGARRPVPRRLVTALACLSVLGLILPTAARAAVPVSPTAYTDPSFPPTNVFPGAYNTYGDEGGQVAAGLDMQLSNDFSSGDTITVPIEVGSSPSPNIGSIDQAVSFNYEPAAAPSVNYANTSATANDTAPTFAVSFATNPADSQAVKDAGLTDEMVISFTDSASGPPSDSWTLTVELSYALGSSAGGGANGVPVDVAPYYTSGAIMEAFNSGPSSPGGTPVVTAYIQHYKVTEPPVGISSGQLSSIPGYTLQEGSPGLVRAGGHWLTASSGSFEATATISAVNMTVGTMDQAGNCPAVGSSSVTVNVYQGAYVFCVVQPSTASTGPGSFTVSGMTLFEPNAGPVRIGYVQNTTWFQEGPQPAVTSLDNYRIAGQSADDTAAVAAESVERQLQMNGGQGGAVILASDAGYQDALSASFLGHAPLEYQTTSGGTGTMTLSVPVLLNPPSPPAQGEATTSAGKAIKAMRATTVYVIGGTAAISQQVVAQLEQIQVGTETNGSPQYPTVRRIAGYSAEQTASDVAEYPSGMNVFLPPTQAAYGLYNSGASESQPPPANSGNLATAILASADEFQDALSASPLAYGATLPVLLNASGTGLDPYAAAAISNLGIRQVIVVGGSSAISDQTVAALIAKGIYVLRIAGTSFSATSALLASYELNDWAPGQTPEPPNDAGLGSYADAPLGAPTITIGTSRGDAFQDALSAAQILGNSNRQSFSPLLLTENPTTMAPATASFLGAYGTGPDGGLVNGPSYNILGDIVFGGTYAQTPALVQAELNQIAAG